MIETKISSDGANEVFIKIDPGITIQAAVQ